MTLDDNNDDNEVEGAEFVCGDYAWVCAWEKRRRQTTGGQRATGKLRSFPPPPLKSRFLF